MSLIGGGDFGSDFHLGVVRDAEFRQQMDRCEQRLGYRFRSIALLQLALTHRSYCAEHPGHESNERLEFLGDAVLGVIVTDRIFVTRPQLPEGRMARVRAALVNSTSLAEMARSIDLGAAIQLGRGEDASGGRGKTSILADCMEAVIGAVYLDGGSEAANRLVLTLTRPRVPFAMASAHGDAKSRLQEVAVASHGCEPVYVLAENGPPHARRYEAHVRVGTGEWGPGAGGSKKEAEQSAAILALSDLGAETADDELAREACPW